MWKPNGWSPDPTSCYCLQFRICDILLALYALIFIIMPQLSGSRISAWIHKLQLYTGSWPCYFLDFMQAMEFGLIDGVLETEYWTPAPSFPTSKNFYGRLWVGWHAPRHRPQRMCLHMLWRMSSNVATKFICC